MVGQGYITLIYQSLRKQEPFLEGSSFHPKELLYQKGSHFLMMPLSLVVLLDHIAKYLLFQQQQVDCCLLQLFPSSSLDNSGEWAQRWQQSSIASAVSFCCYCYPSKAAVTAAEVDSQRHGGATDNNAVYCCDSLAEDDNPIAKVVRQTTTPRISVAVRPKKMPPIAMAVRPKTTLSITMATWRTTTPHNTVVAQQMTMTCIAMAVQQKTARLIAKVVGNTMAAQQTTPLHIVVIARKKMSCLLRCFSMLRPLVHLLCRPLFTLAGCCGFSV
jgi:hypothetical protein